MIITYPIPENTNCVVKKGAKLDFDTVLFEKKISKEIILNVARDLEINPKNIFRHLKKLVGEKIEKDDLLAIKKNLFSSKKVRSPNNGIIKEIDHNQGVIILETFDKKKAQVLSPFKGEVEEINKDSIKINLTKGEDFTLKKSSSDFGGEIFYLEDNSLLSSNDLGKKIILTDNISSYLQMKAEALGIIGFITLQDLPEKTSVAAAQVKNIDDMKKIRKLKFQYCAINGKSAKIYFYQ